MNKWSDLSFKAQEEVDAVIKAKGLAGIGYYHIKTECENCGKEGISIYQKGREVVLGPLVECVTCRTSNVKRLTGETK